MTSKSAVQFPTNRRIHIALAVKDLQRSVAFYQTLLGNPPTKIRPDYARFELAEPPVNLALNEVAGATGPGDPIAHFGIQVKTTDAIHEVARRLAAAGFDTEAQENVTCCYAVQHKVWATDPDGHRWEIYMVLDDAGAHHHSSASSRCCPDAAETTHAVHPNP